jgi:hypothetical protein
MPRATSSPGAPRLVSETWVPLFFIPIAALIAIHPLLVHSVSCGQDMGFHTQSWLDAAQQLRHGHYPRWAYTPAWNAGEPRFIFYPPISWLIGALLTMIAAPIVYIFIALTASGLAMHHLARHYVSPHAALLASAFYIANPYMLFNAFERTAFAELLAAAWIPLLLLAVLRSRPTIRGISVPIALLWLTNAPAAVMGCYTFALVAAIRVVWSLKKSAISTEAQRSGETPVSTLRLTTIFIIGTLLGLALPAFYLVPAAYERRFVQVEMAIIPNMRFQDNFLFGRTADAAHNIVNHTASMLALTVLALTVLAISALILLRSENSVISTNQPLNSVISTDQRERTDPCISHSQITAILAFLTVLIAFLLVPASTPIWNHLPNLAFLQFPWRFLTILSTVLAFAVALILGAPRLAAETWVRRTPTLALTVILPLILGGTAYHLYAQACDNASLPKTGATLFATHHGAPPTDEYTPTAADNDLLRTNNPGYWLATSPNAPAPNTTPTPSELNPNITTDDVPIPDSQTLSAPAPMHFSLHPAQPAFLVLNLRDYPAWNVAVTDECGLERYHPAHISRDDGLVAVPLYCGAIHTIDITWHRTLDQTLGLILSALALLVLAFTVRRNRA